MTPLTLVIPRHNYLIVATKVGGTLIGCMLLLLSGWGSDLPKSPIFPAERGSAGQAGDGRCVATG